jgi:hypothetical protein
MLETRGRYGCDFGTKIVSVGKSVPVMFKNESKPEKMMDSNFPRRWLNFFNNDRDLSSPERGKVTS